MRPFFIGLSIALGFNINPMIMAQNAGAQMQELIRSFTLKKIDVYHFITRLEQIGKVTNIEAEQARQKLENLSSDEIKSLTMDSLQNTHDIDLSGVSFVDQSKQLAQTRAPASTFGQDMLADMLEREELKKEKERQKLKQAQKEILKNGFDIKKFQ